MGHACLAGWQQRRCLSDLAPPKRIADELDAPWLTVDLQERKKLLSFVIVGGGPTGVEVAAELHDLITEDLVKLYPDEVRYCMYCMYRLHRCA